MAVIPTRTRERPVGDAGRARVLIGFGRAIAAPEVAWSLLDAGYEVEVFGRREMRAALRRSHSVHFHDVTAPERDATAAIADVVALADATRPDVVMPLDDAAVWLCDAVGLLPSAVVAGPTGHRAALALDKRVQFPAAVRAGFTVPPTRIVTSVDEALSDPPELPVIAKPALAVTPHGGRLIRVRHEPCTDLGELERFVRAYPPGVPLAIQPYIPGVGEGIFGLARNGRVERWSAHRRVRMMSPHGSGSSACVPAPLDESLRESAAELIAEAGWDGIFMIEVLRDAAGTPWFVELNGRAWGSMALARRMGFEYPAWAVASRLDEGFVPPVPEPREPVVCRHLGRELVHLLIVMRGGHSRAEKLWPSRMQTLRDMRPSRSDRWYNARRGEVRTFVDDTVRTVASALKDAVR